ncbi:MAG: TIGR03089 family protein [Mycobacteriales bacterium]
MRDLTASTGGLAGERDLAQPLLTLYAGGGRVELSGATTANWVAKSANLLIDGLGAPQRVGLLLPLHWQTVALLLAGVATGATVVVARDPAELSGCEAAFVTDEHAEAALTAGVEEVLALSGHPLGAALPSVPAMVQDYAREVPSYADHWGGAAPARVAVEVGRRPLGPLPDLGLSPADRVLVAVEVADPQGLAGLLAVLSAGAALVLVPPPREGLDIAATATTELVTATLGVSVPGLRSVG